MLTRAEHNRICSEQNELLRRELQDRDSSIAATLTEIKSMLHQQDVRTNDHRDRVATALRSLDRKVIIMQTRMGSRFDQEAETGGFTIPP